LKDEDVVNKNIISIPRNPESKGVTSTSLTNDCVEAKNEEKSHTNIRIIYHIYDED